MKKISIIIVCMLSIIAGAGESAAENYEFGRTTFSANRAISAHMLGSCNVNDQRYTLYVNIYPEITTCPNLQEKNPTFMSLSLTARAFLSKSEDGGRHYNPMYYLNVETISFFFQQEKNQNGYSLSMPDGKEIHLVALDENEGKTLDVTIPMIFQEEAFGIIEGDYNGWHGMTKVVLDSKNISAKMIFSNGGEKNVLDVNLVVNGANSKGNDEMILAIIDHRREIVSGQKSEIPL